jgi:hypothetical protein
MTKVFTAGEVLTAADVNTYLVNTTGSGNAIINAAFEINQRGFTSHTGSQYGFDRWLTALSGAIGTTTAETFTPGAAPVAGQEARNFLRFDVTTGNDFARIIQRIESVRTFAGQTVTLSFYAKGTNPTTAGKINARFTQNFGTGGSPSSVVSGSELDVVLTANWQRYSFTFDIPSIAGKTLGTNNDDHVNVDFGQLSNISTDAWTLDLWGVQLEAGTVATPFRRNANSIQGELAACQRYYYRIFPNGQNKLLSPATASSTTSSAVYTTFPVPMRISPTALEQSGTAADYSLNYAGTQYQCSAIPTYNAQTTTEMAFTVFTTSAVLTAGQGGRAVTTSVAGGENAFLGWSAEL